MTNLNSFAAAVSHIADHRQHQRKQCTVDANPCFSSHMQCICGSRLLAKCHFGKPVQYNSTMKHAHALLVPLPAPASRFIRHVRSSSAVVAVDPPARPHRPFDMRDFFGCYLLTSLDPKNKGRTYIGFTVNPRRRLRQHNGEITAGAHRTKRGRPWDMVLVAYGFPTKVQALQFEWAWQHPTASKAVRGAAQKLGTTAMRGAKGKVRLLFEMLNMDPWCYYPLQVQILSSSYTVLRSNKCLAPPPHVTVSTAPMEVGFSNVSPVLNELLCLTKLGVEPEKEVVLHWSLNDLLPVVVDDDFDEGPPEEDAEQDDCEASLLLSDDMSTTCDLADSALSHSELHDQEASATEEPGTELLSEKDRRKAEKQRQQAEKEQRKAEKAKEAAAKLCCVCGEKADAKWFLCACSVRSHVECLAKRFLKESGEEQGLPVQGTCPNCGALQKWADVLAKCESVPWRQSSKAKPRAAAKGKKAAAAAVGEPAMPDTELQQSPMPARSRGRGRPKKAVTDAAAASGPAGTAAQTDMPPDSTLIDMTGSEPASPAKKTKGRPPKAKSPAGSPAKKAKAAKAGVEGKPKGRQKKAEVLEELVPEELPKGPSFPFDINRVLALGSHCGVPMDRAGRDELAGQYEVLHSMDACRESTTDTPNSIPSANGGTAHPVVSASALSGPLSCTHDDNSSVGFMDGGHAPEQNASADGKQGVPLSELSLRDRLHKVHCLLQQAGLSPAEAMLGLTHPEALDPANASAAVGGYSLKSMDHIAQDHLSMDDLTQDPGQTSTSMHICSDASPMAKLSSGVTYDELISLISPTPAQASVTGTDTDSPIQRHLLAPQLSPPELEPTSQRDDTPVYVTSPLALVSPTLFHQQQQQQQQQDDHLVEPLDSPGSACKAPQDTLHSFQEQEPVPLSEAAHSQEAPFCCTAVPTAVEQHGDEMQSAQGVQPSASCRQSPASSTGEVSQQGKKRSRSLPRGRKKTVDKMLKSPSQSKVSLLQKQDDGWHDADTLSLPEGRQTQDNATPHTKTANKLAALQMQSPGYTPSPMPLRRRLQENQPRLQEVLPQVESPESCEIICIDC